MPGAAQEARSVDMEFHYRDAFGDGALPKAYERLLLDAMNGDPALFTRSDEIEMAWQLIDPILAGWNTSPLRPYSKGSAGPREADDFMSQDGRSWLEGCSHG